MTPSSPACLQQGANLRESLGGTCNEHLLLARPDSPLWQLHASMVILARHNAYSGEADVSKLTPLSLLADR